MPSLGGSQKPKDDVIANLIGSSNRVARRNTALHGPRKVGKSYFMCTASASWPDNMVDRHKHLTNGERWSGETRALDDLCVLSADDGALDFLGPLGIECPYTVSLDMALSEAGVDSYGLPDVETALDYCIEAMTEVARSTPTIEFVCIDTISVLDKALVEQLSRKFDGRDMYRALLGRHRKLYGRVKAMGRHWILNCHSKALFEHPTKSHELAKAAEKKKQATYHTPVEVAPDITGQGAQVWLANVSFQGVAMSKVNPQTRTKQRKVYFDIVDGHEAGSRFEGLMDPNGETNLRDVYRRCGLVE